MQAFEVFADPRGASGVKLDGQQVELGQFEQMRGFAAGGGAGVEDAHPVLHGQQFGGTLCADVLHRHQPFAETW